LLWFNGATSPARQSLAVGWQVVVGAVVAAAIGIVAAFFAVWNGLLGLGPTEFIVLIVLGVLLFGRTLPNLGRALGEFLVQKTPCS
jgi:hypothetical protein